MNPIPAIQDPKLRGEFMRAINIVVNVQLGMFRESPAPTKDDLLTDFMALYDHLNKDALSKDAIVQTARTVLSKNLDSFNDPFANYVSPQALEKYKQRRGGKLVGVGIKFRARKNAYPVIIGPLLGGPLEHANLKPGDEIKKIDGVDQFGVDSKTIASSLKGSAKSKVSMHATRANLAQPIEIEMQRQQVDLHYARAEILPGEIGYIKISRFGGKTHLRVQTLLQGLLEQNATALVLDLRDNPGGSTKAARAIVSLFSDDPHVYAEQFKSGKTRLLPRIGKVMTKLPLSVLVNEKSMSSSEIVAGALQVAERATIVGTPTYGKGLIQRVFDLQPPLSGAIRATIAAYATLNEVLIHGVGIVPDIYIPTAEAEVFREVGSLNISAAARRYRRELLNLDLRSRYDVAKAEQLINQVDSQLESAISALKDTSRI